MKLYRYGANFEPITGMDAPEQVEIRIPAVSEDEAYRKLRALLCAYGYYISKFYLISVEEY